MFSADGIQIPPQTQMRDVGRNKISDTQMTQDEIKQFHDIVDENIRQYGYHMTFVFEDETPSFCYSTGVYKTFDIPEIFISSLPQNLAFELVKNYVNKFKKTKSIPLDKKLTDLTERFPVYLISVPTDKLKDYVLSSIRFYKNEDYKYLQLIYPDTNGHFPNDKGYDYDQIIMGGFTN